MKPCPFCGGPPVALVANYLPPYGAAPEKDDYGDDGLYVNAYVFCHECGANGPGYETLIFGRAEYVLAEDAGIALWELRDARHRHLYDANQDQPSEQRPTEL